MAKENWIERLARSLDAAGGETIRREIIGDGAGLSSSSNPGAKARWVAGMIERMQAHFDAEQCQQIMSHCSCAFSQSLIRQFKQAYTIGGGLADVVEAMRAEQRESIIKNLGADQALTQLAENELFMHSPELCEDGSILHTGRPYHPKAYLLASDDQGRRQHMCHCGWINGSKGEIPVAFCGCGTGFYRILWESLLDAPVTVTVESTVFSGGQYCQMRVNRS